MYLTGKWIKKVETLRDLEKEIKYFEEERIKNDLLNYAKLKPLYEVYYKLLKEMGYVKWQDLRL